ncbi:hypothetical protein PIROE2DRAFT_4647 [Piromyces sp. E2]|nr:hypothetical protein PIROE2DRAFT_4647 [Piromyces sp. E2]|eukprot:OUM67836.1 hypothetical protein PIROE2DRAFT_4647 [Piromyces sp. E2]
MPNNYYKEQVKRPVSEPPKNIMVFGSHYVFKHQVDVTIETGFKIILYDINDNPLFNIRNNIGIVCIYKGDDIDEQSIIKNKDSIVARKFTVTYIDQITKQEEILDMNCDRHFGSEGFFIGKEKEGAPMVGKFIQAERLIFAGEYIKYSI